MTTKLQVQLVYGAVGYEPTYHTWSRTFSGMLPCALSLKIGELSCTVGRSELDLNSGVMVLNYTARRASPRAESDAITFSRLGFTQEPT